MNMNLSINTALSALAGVFLLAQGNAHSQSIKIDANQFEPISVSVAPEKLDGKDVLKVVKNASVKAFDEPTFARLRDAQFNNGTIEVKVRSRLSKDAPDFARGFIGLAFRINDDNTRFESIYVRPTNGRAEDPVRRNRAIQYFAYPDYKFDRLRKDAADAYESSANIGLDEWITMRVVVKGKQATLFLNGNKQPSLVVNDLKNGKGTPGAVGLWVDIGTEGYFTDLKIDHE